MPKAPLYGLPHDDSTLSAPTPADSDLVQQYPQNTLTGTSIPGCLTTAVNHCYVSLNGSNDNLTITDSTLYAQYVCQVPRRKDFGALLIAILVADIVFIQALYTL